MAKGPFEPAEAALATLRRRLRDGSLPPGQRITVVEIADDLKLSNTPVREALCRLAGEGVIEDHRGQGFFVRQWGAADIESGYRTCLALLLLAEAPRRPGTTPPNAPENPELVEASPITATERLFSRWAAESGSRLLTRNFGVAQAQLAAVRRLEPRQILDLEAEAEQMAALSPPAPRAARLAGLRHFYGRRIPLAEVLARELEALGVRPKL